jgi:flagellar hook-length control protein FliK
MNTALPPLPSPDVLAAIAPRPAPARAPETTTAVRPSAAGSEAARDARAADDGGADRDFATRLAREMRPERDGGRDARDHRDARGARARGGDGARERAETARTPERPQAAGADRPADRERAGTTATKAAAAEEGGDDAPQGGKDLPSWLPAELLPTRPAPPATQPAPVIAADGAMVPATTADGAVALPSTDTPGATLLAAAGGDALPAPLAAAAPAAESPATVLPTAPLAAADAAADVVDPPSVALPPASATAVPPAAPDEPRAGADAIARLVAQARADSPPVVDAASGKRLAPDAARPQSASPTAVPAAVALPAEVAKTAPMRRGFAFAAAGESGAAPAPAIPRADVAGPAPAIPLADVAGPFNLPVPQPTAPPTPAPAAPPAQLQLPTPVDSPDWGRQLGDRVNWLVDQDLTNAQLKLTPAHLGPLEIRISIADDRATVWFGTHSHVTREALEAAAPKLRELLGAQGYTQVNVNVNVDVSQQAFRERMPSGSRYEPEAALALDAGVNAAGAAAAPSGARPGAVRSRLDAYA